MTATTKRRKGDEYNEEEEEYSDLATPCRNSIGVCLLRESETVTVLFLQTSETETM
jgi:hypothetical protein